jgi:membrane protein implicated in regulation of membrane protease activity
MMKPLKKRLLAIYEVQVLCDVYRSALNLVRRTAQVLKSVFHCVILLSAAVLYWLFIMWTSQFIFQIFGFCLLLLLVQKMFSQTESQKIEHAQIMDSLARIESAVKRKPL